MSIWHIYGGNRLTGSTQVQGAKNAVLPIMAASVLAGSETVLHNVPDLKDVTITLRILRHLGCTAERDGDTVHIDSRGMNRDFIPHDLMRELRSSVIFLGAILTRFGTASLSMPGGCELGPRPVNLHLDALRALGAEVTERGGDIVCCAHDLKGRRILLPFPSVGATENTVLAACAAKGETVIHGAAREPEIIALQEYLNLLGADISGAGTGDIYIRGMEPETQVCFRIMPDRIVASTLACASAACGGDVELRGVDPAHFSTVLYFLNQSGCDIISNKRSVRLISDGRLKAVEEISTAPYPGFPTDAQPVLMAALLKAEGRTLITENIFENRFRQAAELRRLGADITVSGRRAEIWGVDRLRGTMLNATDLRGGAAMIIAGLCAEGETVVRDDGHVTRGYERFDRKLRSLGADVNLEY